MYTHYNLKQCLFLKVIVKKGIQLRMFHSGHTLIRRPRHRHTRIYLIDQFTKKYCNPVCFGCAYTIYAYKLCNVLLHRNIFLCLLSIFMYVTCFSVCCLIAINISLVWSLCKYSVQQKKNLSYSSKRKERVANLQIIWCHFHIYLFIENYWERKLTFS